MAQKLPFFYFKPKTRTRTSRVLLVDNGFAEGNKLSMKHAEGRYLTFVNMDTKELDGWLRKLVNTADEQ